MKAKLTLIKWAALLVLFSTLNSQLSTARAQSTAFTYQGRVLDHGTNFNGTGQFKFALVTSTNFSHQATAMAEVNSGFITSYVVSSGGSGYTASPLVTISDVSGSGAMATANLIGGVVTSITVNSVGSGYSSTPTVTIAPPPPNFTYTTYWSNDGTSSAGSEPASAVSLGVSNGLFTVVLGDVTLANMQAMAASIFGQPNLQLRIWFNDGVQGSAALSPLQNLTPTPYAVMAGSADSAGSLTGTLPASQVAGTIPLAQLPATLVTNGAINVNLSGNLSGTFTGDGGGLTNVNAATLAIPFGMTLIPAGVFTMGNSIGDDDITDANPTNTTVSAFYMDLNLVTYSQWQSVYFWATNHGYSFVNPGLGKAANHPVQTVDWYDAVKWCNARSQQAGLAPVYYTDPGLTQVYTNGEVAITNVNWTANGYRLPTEAEWEKAARGGLSGQRFPWGNVITENLANYTGYTNIYSYDFGPNGNNAAFTNGVTPYTSPVGYFAPNGYGLYDMAGNLFEYCWDFYGTPYAGGTDPRGPATGNNRVLRGGDWADGAYWQRCAERYAYVPSSPNYSDGFRCVRGH